MNIPTFLKINVLPSLLVMGILGLLVHYFNISIMHVVIGYYFIGTFTLLAFSCFQSKNVTLVERISFILAITTSWPGAFCTVVYFIKYPDKRPS